MESIKDKVAIVGRGCTRFGERWDAGFDHLVIEAAYEAYEEVHDCFTSTELLLYELLGFSPDGGARDDIDSGFFELGGGSPVNSNGGLNASGTP